MSSLLAAFYGKNFGQGVNELAPGENALVLFLLAMLASVLGLFGLFIYLSARGRHGSSLPSETEDLLQELREEDHSTSSPPLSTPSGEGEDERQPWERDPNWWNKNE
ncbi:MAG: hypothetical protein AAF191_10110 [Verrucomicrobiota bacterium]